MSLPRHLAALVRAFLVEGRRSKAALFWNLAFPLVFLVGLILVFGGDSPRQRLEVLPGVLTINLIAAAFFGISLHMVGLREAGFYRRLKATPIRALTVVLAHSLTSLTMLALSLALQLAVAVWGFGLEIAGAPWQVAAALLVSAVAFIPLGLMVGSAAGNMKSAPAIANLLFFPLIFLSGSAMPLALLPGWIQRIAELLPATYVGEVLRAAILGGRFEPSALAVGVLLLTGVVALGFDVALFRWESREPLDRGALALALGVLVAIYASLFVFGVDLDARRMPGAPPAAEAPAAPGAGEGRLTLAGMTLLDGDGGRIENAWVQIESGRIVGVGSGAPPEPLGEALTGLDGLTLIPGLVDSHVHVGGSAGGSSSPGEYLPARVLRDLQVYLALGVTSVVSMTDSLDDLESLRAMVEAGTMRAPRPFFTGPGLTAPGGHPARFFVFVPGLADTMTRQVETADEAAAAARELVGRVDLLKLYLEAGWVDETFPVLAAPPLRAAIEAAAERGVASAVHVDSDRHARLAIAAGAASLEHVPPDLAPETIAALAERDIVLVPTLVAFEGLAKLFAGEPLADDPLVERWVDPNILDSLTSPDSWIAQAKSSPASVDYYTERYAKAREALAAAIEGGAPIVAGSDAGNPAAFHGPGLLRELELLVELGLEPGEALVAATGAAADRLGSDQIGRIAPGAWADLVLLGADPTADIRNLRDVRAVYLAGRRLDRDTLLSTSPGEWMPGGIE